MSLIGLLPAAEKQVHLGRLHMRPNTGISKQLEGTRITRKGFPNTKVLPPTLTMVAARGQYPYRPTITPSKSCCANLY